LLDEPADHDERDGQVQVEVDDPGVAFGAAPQLAVPVHPGAATLDHPALAGLDRGWDALGAISPTKPNSAASSVRVAALLATVDRGTAGDLAAAGS
jgi:hypothetical protein